jgi:hypothetical protein
MVQPRSYGPEDPFPLTPPPKSNITTNEVMLARSHEAGVSRTDSGISKTYVRPSATHGPARAIVPTTRM